MSEWKELIDESRHRWNTNAEAWDDYMGETSNQFHRELIRPITEKLLEINKGNTVLDIACGNGNFSRRLAELGARVVAFDYSAKMIERARQRSRQFTEQIDYRVMDATDLTMLSELADYQFDSAVANMALMDIADIAPLVKALEKLLKANGTFVFSIAHPCFQTPGMRKVQETEEINGTIVTRNSIQTFDYLTSQPYEAVAIRTQTTAHYMFHRPLSYYCRLFFAAGFRLDGMEEPSFKKEQEGGKFDWYDIPPVVIFRFRKIN